MALHIAGRPSCHTPHSEAKAPTEQGARFSSRCNLTELFVLSHKALTRRFRGHPQPNRQVASTGPAKPGDSTHPHKHPASTRCLATT